MNMVREDLSFRGWSTRVDRGPELLGHAEDVKNLPAGRVQESAEVLLTVRSVAAPGDELGSQAELPSCRIRSSMLGYP